MLHLVAMHLLFVYVCLLRVPSQCSESNDLYNFIFENLDENNNNNRICLPKCLMQNKSNEMIALS